MPDESRIIQYLFKKGLKNPALAGELAKKLTKYSDIKHEVLFWLINNQFPENGLDIHGYTAAKIAELAPFLDGIGVYDFLVDLRENPDQAQKRIAAGFPIY